MPDTDPLELGPVADLRKVEPGRLLGRFSVGRVPMYLELIEVDEHGDAVFVYHQEDIERLYLIAGENGRFAECEFDGKRWVALATPQFD